MNWLIHTQSRKRRSGLVAKGLAQARSTVLSRHIAIPWMVPKSAHGQLAPCQSPMRIIVTIRLNSTRGSARRDPPSGKYT